MLLKIQSLTAARKNMPSVHGQFSEWKYILISGTKQKTVCFSSYIKDLVYPGELVLIADREYRKVYQEFN